ncbi:MAG: TIGR02710 family CRISPR-associated CARF protein [Nitrospira sp.]|nr:TIGR02710 family CRISPR-associated CARF protein [Nitrospira sp.]MCP9442067.1 TIGR02710 family CRISPR-associated CARF protein [Nitrospira sp.]
MSDTMTSSVDAMIVSVGGSIEPLVTTLRAHRPTIVIFFASEQTVELIGTIKDRVRDLGIPETDRKVVTSDPQDLVTCYTDALRCAALIDELDIPHDRVAVDFTGGTKVMSAALALATVGKGFSFAYVGGYERSKEGRGVVITGSETIVHRDDPFAVFAVEERRRLALFFRTFQFTAALTLIQSALARPLREPDRLAFKLIGEVAHGYLFWERFEYQRALETLGRCLKQWTTAVQANPSLRYANILPTVAENVTWLEDLSAHTARFSRYHQLLVADLLANADRRAAEGSYDDGIVRLYRALELGAQVSIQRRLGCGTDRVPINQIPETVRPDFLARYRQDEAGTLQLPLEASYRLSAALGEPEGQRFEQQRGQFKKVQSARNSSWLAHGMNPANEKDYRHLREVVLTILGDQPTITFAMLEET